MLNQSANALLYVSQPETKHVVKMYTPLVLRHNNAWNWFTDSLGRMFPSYHLYNHGSKVENTARLKSNNNESAVSHIVVQVQLCH